MSFNAVGPGTDLAGHARSLARTRDAVMAGSGARDRPRSVVSRSWSRTLGHGLRPDSTNPRRVLADTEARRRGSPLAPVIDEFRQVVDSYADAARCILVVTDADGVILWRHGAGRVLNRADGLGFAEGALWTEQTVGTNAIGTALAEAAPVQLFAAEHFEDGQVPWYCTAAPIHDPRTGALIGVVDISGPALTIHPVVAALVDAMVRLAQRDIQLRHWQSLETLRSRAAARWSLVGGPALLVDADGWVAQSVGLSAPERVATPRVDEYLAVSGIGLCRPEPLAGGWLLRAPTAADTLHLELDPAHQPTLTVSDGASAWRCRLTGRQVQVLLLLHRAGRDGLSGAALSRALYGDAEHRVTVRAEISRLRRTVGDLIVTRPYRLAPGIRLTVRAPDEPGALAL